MNSKFGHFQAKRLDKLDLMCYNIRKEVNRMAANQNILRGIKHDIDTHGEPLQIMAVADLHIGDSNCNYKLIDSLIERIQTTPNLYCVLIGDLMNTAIAGSRSDVYSEQMTADEQLDRCTSLLEPIRDKILAITPGNHEERISRSVGVDMTYQLAKRLDISHLYDPASALVFVKFGRSSKTCAPITYSIYCSHGRGGGRKIGGKLNSLQDYAQTIDADVFIVGHTHLPASFKTQTYHITPQRAQATLHEQLFVNTASALNYGGYGKRGGYQPASNSYPIITLDNIEHHVTVTL